MDKPSEAEYSKTLFRAKNTVYRLLNIRLRSAFEIRDKLKQKHFSADIIKSTVNYFEEIGLIDDEKFAREWIASRLRRPFGWRRIQFELRRKGIADAVIKQLQSACCPEDELIVVRELVGQKCKSYKSIDRNKKRQRIYGFLTRRGFSSATIMKVLREI